MRACSLREWPMEVIRSPVPQMIAVGTEATTGQAAHRSSEAKAG